MGNGLIAFLASIGASAWIYTKLMRSSGNNVTSALTVAAISGVCIFVVAIMLLNLIPA